MRIYDVKAGYTELTEWVFPAGLMLDQSKIAPPEKEKYSSRERSGY